MGTNHSLSWWGKQLFPDVVAGAGPLARLKAERMPSPKGAEGGTGLSRVCEDKLNFEYKFVSINVAQRPTEEPLTDGSVCGGQGRAGLWVGPGEGRAVGPGEAWLQVIG